MHPAFAQGYVDTMQKLAAPISEEDIAAGLAGHKNREISQEEIEEFAKQRMEGERYRTRNSPLIGGAVGGGLGGLLGGALGAGRGAGGVGSILGGVGGGMLAGGGIGAALGALRRYAAGLRGQGEGRELGGIAQEGQVPRYMQGYLKHQDLVPHARGIQEDTASPLTPEQFATIRESLQKQMMAEHGLEGALSGGALGAMYGGRARDDDSEGYDYRPAMAGAAIGGGRGALEGLQEARSRANQLSDLYERGYGHLAGRIYEGS